jgi:O-antigen ligase
VSSVGSSSGTVGVAGSGERMCGALATVVIAALFVPPPAYPQLFAVRGAEIRVLDILFAGFVVTLAAARRGERAWTMQLARTPTVLAIVAMFVVLAVSLTQVPAGGRTDAIVSLAKLAEVIFVALLAGTVIARRRLVAQFAAALGVAAAVSGAVSLAHAFQEDGWSGLVVGRGFGLGDLNPDVLALGGVATALLGMALVAGSRPLDRRLGAVALAGAAVAIYAGKSIFAACALAAGTAILVVLLRRRWILLGAAWSAIVLLFVVAVRLPDVQGGLRLAHAERTDASGRREAAEGSITHRLIAMYITGLIARDNAVTGVGWLQSKAPRYTARETRYGKQARRRFPNASSNLFPSPGSPNPVHNAYLQVLAEGGVLALLALLAAVVLPLRLAVQGARRLTGTPRLQASASAAVLFAGALWLNAVSPLGGLDMALPWAFAGLVLGLVASVPGSSRGSTRLHSSGAEPPARARV